MNLSQSHLKEREARTHQQLTGTVVRGIILPLLAQAVVTWPLEWFGNKYGWDIALPLALAFLVVSGLGFRTLTAETSRGNRLLIAVLYFPLMFAASLYVAVFAFQSVEGKGNF